MKNNTIEIILNSGYFLPLSGQFELAEWLKTTVQPFILKQEQSIRDKLLTCLQDSPPIHLS